MEYKGYFDAVDGSPSYDSAEHSKVMDMLSVGVQSGYENELEVVTGTGLQVIVDSGGMFSNGRYYIQSEAADGASPKALLLDAATTGYLRKDRVVVEFDTENKTATVKISKGVEATSSPSENALADADNKWEEPLAIVNIDGGSITSIEDDRYIFGARCKQIENPYCQVERGSGNQTSGTYIEFQAAPTDTEDIWSATNPELLTVPEDGDYLLCYDIGFTTSQVGHAQCNILVNEIGEVLTRVYCSGSNALMKGSHILRLKKDDYIRIGSPVILDASNYVRNLEVHVTLKKIN